MEFNNGYYALYGVSTPCWWASNENQLISTEWASWLFWLETKKKKTPQLVWFSYANRTSSILMLFLSRQTDLPFSIYSYLFPLCSPVVFRCSFFLLLRRLSIVSGGTKQNRIISRVQRWRKRKEKNKKFVRRSVSTHNSIRSTVESRSIHTNRELWIHFFKIVSQWWIVVSCHSDGNRRVQIKRQLFYLKIDGKEKKKSPFSYLHTDIYLRILWQPLRIFPSIFLLSSVLFCVCV